MHFLAEVQLIQKVSQIVGFYLHRSKILVLLSYKRNLSANKLMTDRPVQRLPWSEGRLEVDNITLVKVSFQKYNTLVTIAGLNGADVSFLCREGLLLSPLFQLSCFKTIVKACVYWLTPWRLSHRWWLHWLGPSMPLKITPILNIQLTLNIHLMPMLSWIVELQQPTSSVTLKWMFMAMMKLKIIIGTPTKQMAWKVRCKRREFRLHAFFSVRSDMKCRYGGFHGCKALRVSPIMTVKKSSTEFELVGLTILCPHNSDMFILKRKITMVRMKRFAKITWMHLSWKNGQIVCKTSLRLTLFSSIMVE